ncbi:MAG: DUF4169 family protein [Pseudomonadota bacterium]|nr:DUF4169 family protein [Pseudomonadota bacterium]
MVTPINLNKARKARARADKQQRAAENRVKFGRTKAEKERDRRAEERATIQLDQSKRND